MAGPLGCPRREPFHSVFVGRIRVPCSARRPSVPSAGMSRRRLTPKQHRFIEEYLCDLNGSAAAIRAGYSPNTADQIAYQLLQIPSVRAAVQEAMRQRAARTRVTADKVVRELALIAFSDLNHYEVTDDGRLRVRRFADRGASRAVASVKRKERTITRGNGDEKGNETIVDTEI